MKREIEPIAHIYTDFKEKFGIPRQSGKVSALVGRIVFEERFRHPDAIRGIEEFSHLWLLFDFSLAHREEFSPTVRPPRLGGNKRIGVFASRAPFRPNNIGLSSVKLLGIEKNDKEGNVLIVSGADILSGTPIYDIKPYISYTDSHPDALCSYADENIEHKLEVDFPDDLLNKLPEEKREAAVLCIAEDPRPSYQEDPERVYVMSFAGFEIGFKVKENRAEVISVK